MDTSLIMTLYVVLRVSVIERFHCTSLCLLRSKERGRACYLNHTGVFFSHTKNWTTSKSQQILKRGNLKNEYKIYPWCALKTHCLMPQHPMILHITALWLCMHITIKFVVFIALLNNSLSINVYSALLYLALILLCSW